MINHLLKANDPFELYERVQEYIVNGYDLQGTLSTSDVSELGQWVVGLPAMSDYILVVADDLHEYESQCQVLMGQGWDFWYGSQRWGGKILQWMQKEKSLTVAIEGAHHRKPVVIKAELISAANYHWLTRGGARPIPLLGKSILEG
jgi:hypothetical protein